MQKITKWHYLFIYLLVITFAEISIAYIDVVVGIVLHIIILCLLIAHSGIISKDVMTINKLQWILIRDNKRPFDVVNVILLKQVKLQSVLLALTLVPLIRILSLVMPLIYFSHIHWFIIIGCAIYAALLAIVVQQKINIRDCGLRLPNKQHIPIELGVTLLGIPFGTAEFLILRPAPIINSFAIGDLVVAVLIMFIATGLMEELIFRGLLQKKTTDLLGVWPGILYVTVIFAVLHIGNLSILEVVLVFSIGLCYALVVRKTKTIIGVSISHTLVNIFFFILCPLVLG